MGKGKEKNGCRSIPGRELLGHTGLHSTFGAPKDTTNEFCV
jgi:hypothetical protein